MNFILAKFMWQSIPPKLMLPIVRCMYLIKCGKLFNVVVYIVKFTNGKVWSHSCVF